MKEEAKEVVEIAIGYTKQMVDALTPLAKQAYEIGLLTLQIDAVQSILFGLLFLVLAIVLGGIAYAGYKQASKGEKYKGEYLALEPGSNRMIFGGMVAIACSIPACYTLFSVWLWVKLFSPELWLAHQAVEKILK
jgi:hypothetical protein